MSQREAVTVLRWLFPIWALIGMFSLQYVPTTLIVFEDVAVTVSNISANELLFRAGIAGSLVTQLIHILAVIAMYKLFKSVDKPLASLLVILGLVGVPIAMFNEFNQFAVLILLSGVEYLNVFGVEQLQSLIMFFLSLYQEGMMIATIFWGLWLFPYGLLVKKSGYFPKILGILVVVAGIGYTLAAFVHFLFPEYGSVISFLDFLTMGEVVFMVWVLFKGAKLPSDEGGEVKGLEATK